MRERIHSGLMDVIRAANSRIVPWIADNLPELFNRAAARYIAGRNVTEGIRFMRHELEKGHLVSFDQLGESALSRAQADDHMRTYHEVADLLYANGFGTLQASISFKLSAITALPDPPILGLHDALPRVQELLRRHPGRWWTQDQEDSSTQTLAYAIANQVWTVGYHNFGIVIQTGMHNHEDWMDTLLGNKPYHSTPAERKRVRIVRGIYREKNPSIATDIPNKQKARIPAAALRALDSGARVQVATHDRRTIEKVLDMADSNGFTHEHLEFGVLVGPPVNDKIIPFIQDAGYQVRKYCPVEFQRDAGRAYMIRRLIESPDTAIRSALSLVTGR